MSLCRDGLRGKRSDSEQALLHLCARRAVANSQARAAWDPTGDSRPDHCTAMLVARHLLALILGLADATKRARSDDSSDSEQDELSTITTIQTVSPTASTGTGPVTENTSLYFLKRVVQSAGCLFSDAVACSGGFDDPMGHAAILLSSIFAKKHPECGPAKSPKADLGSVEQLRIELAKQIKSGQTSKGQISKAKADELQLIAVKKLVDLTLGTSDEDLTKHSRSIKRAWKGKKAFSGLLLSAMDELFAVADRTAALFDRSAFVWPLGRTSSDPLHPEEKLYAAAVVVMCRRLGVRPVSIFLSTSTFESTLPQTRYNKCINWRRPGFQVIAVAVGKTVQGLDPAESCKGLADELGVSEPLDYIPYVSRYRHQPSNEHKPPMPPTPLATPLPTELREEFAEADRLLLIRSLQVAYMLLSQTAVDQRSLGDLLLQASTVMSHLLKLNDHDLPPYLITHKPGTCFTALDLLRVVAEADRRPDLGAVSTVGDVMIAAAQTIFRHLYLALPITVLNTVEKFNAVQFAELHSRDVAILTNYLLRQKTPHVLDDSSSFARLYEASDAILWAAFRVFSKQLSNSDKTFVLCTREMSEKIPIARQYTCYLIPAIIRKMFGGNAQSIEAAVRNLLLAIAPVTDSSGNLHASTTMPQTPNTMVQTLGAMIQTLSAMVQAPGAMPLAPGIMPLAPSVMLPPPAAILWDQIATMMSQAAAMANQIASAYSGGQTAQIVPMTSQAGVMANQIANRDPGDDADPVLSKTVIVMRDFFPDGSASIRSLSDIPSTVFPYLSKEPRAEELTSANRLAATLQLHTLDAKLKRDRILFSDTDHVTVLLDALVAMHLLRKGRVAQLARIPRTRISDISTGDKDGLARLLMEILFTVTSVRPVEEGSISTALTELTKRLASAVEATTSD